jgi:calpain
MMGCSIEPDPNVTEARMDEGLVRGHAYSITKAVKAQIETPSASGQIPLIRVRNPWGNEAEWNGAWSDRSAEWQFIPDEEKENLGLTFEADGEFWMSYKDFTRYWDQVAKVILFKYYKHLPYALAHDMSFLCFRLFWPNQVHCKVKLKVFSLS